MSLSAKEAREIGIISRAINDPEINPYLKRRWDPKQIEERARDFSPEVLELWLNSIMHLQRYAWRLHAASCEDKACPGCPGYSVRMYFHKKQAEYIASDANEAWVITGNRWGKTDSLVFIGVCRLLGYNPLTNELYPLPQHIWLVGLSFPMVRDILVPKFKKQMPELGLKWSGDDVPPWEFSKTDLIATIFNGSTCGFKSADAGIEKFRGAGKDLIGFDEEPPKEVYSEASIRVEAGKDLTIRGAMTPDPFKGLTWTYHEILQNTERLADPSDLRIWGGSIHDNPGITERVKKRLSSKLEEWEKEVRFEGHYISGLGRCAFDAEGLRKLRESATPAVNRRSVLGGEILIWEPPLPSAGYIISCDAAEGLEHGDNGVVHVLRRDITPKLVASYAGKMDPDELGRLALGLADEYNEAWIVIEMNNHGFAVMSVIRQASYANIYTEKSFDKWGMKESRKWGWYTNSVSRPILVDEIARCVRDQSIEVPDIETLSEMGTFIINAKGKAEAQSGCKDDRVIALGLGLQGHIRCSIHEPTKKKQELVDLPQVDQLAWMGM